MKVEVQQEAVFLACTMRLGLPKNRECAIADKLGGKIAAKNKGEESMHTRILLSMSCAVVAMVPQSAFAQASPQASAQAANSPVVIGEIIVTAQKRSESINKVGMTITAATGDTLAQRGITTNADLTKLVPGLHYTPSPYQQPVYVLRGVGLYDSGLASSPAVSVYVDQLPLTSPIMSEVPPLDLERVEILNGPQGTLFGQNSTGGAINFITAKPQSEFGAGGTVSYERFNKASINGFVTGPLAENLTARLSGGVVSGGAWQYSLSRPNDYLGDSRTLQGRLILDWRASDTLKFELNVNGFKDRSDTVAHQLVAVAPVLPFLASTYLLNAKPAPDDPRAAEWYGGLPLRKDDGFFQTALRADLDLSDSLRVVSLSNYQHMHEDRFTDLMATTGYGGVAVSFNQPNAPAEYTHSFGTVDAFTQELRLEGQTSRLHWIAGGNYVHSKVDDQIQFVQNVTTSAFGSLIGVTPGYFGFPAESTKQTINEYAAFANVDYNLTDRLVFHAGARGTISHRDGNNCTYNWNPSVDGAALEALFEALEGRNPAIPIPPGGCIAFTSTSSGFAPLGPTPFHLHEKNLSWRLGLDYTTLGGTLLYASQSRGWKSGIVSPIAAFVVEEYEPATQERLDAYEVGIKAPLFDRRAHLNLAAFYYDYKDKQVRSKILDPVFGALEKLINIPQSRLWGLQGDLQIRPVAGLDLSVAATYLNTRVLKDANPLVYNQDNIQGSFIGSDLPFTPKLTIVADGQYEWGFNDSLNLFAGPSLTYHSRTNSTFDTRAAPAPGYVIPSYAQIDLRAGIASRSGSWRLTVFGRNITNKFYTLNTFKGVDTVYRDAGMPATYGISLTLKTR